MNYEEKYKQALERARISRLQLLDIGEEATEIEHIFPELKESEEDKKMIELLIEIFKVNYPDGFYKTNPANTLNMGGKHSSEIIEWLKSLKDRVMPQPKQEWSEEDENLCYDSCAFLNNELPYVNDEHQKRIKKCICWLKSLKTRSHWKPSEEQMKALKLASDKDWDIDGNSPLYTLYNDLKKL